MPLIKAATAPLFQLPGLTVNGLAAPSRGSAETSVWRLTLSPGAPAVPHSVTREEIFVALSGQATATVNGETHLVAAGDTLVVPPGETFDLANPGGEPFVALAVCPVGGQAVLPGEAPFVPPWAT
jgi:mannose-6-phosphate isomerase-like protein (cupin superfamily)